MAPLIRDAGPEGPGMPSESTISGRHDGPPASIVASQLVREHGRVVADSIQPTDYQGVLVHESDLTSTAGLLLQI